MFRTIRNHWKKSLFAFCAVSYGSKWMYDRYQANKIRQYYCGQMATIGSQTYPPMSRLNRIAVLLNGKANNGKAKSIYDKTVFPLLHLTGLDVRVYRLDTITEPDGLKDLLINKIEPNELSALVIVGGDGTLSELTPYFFQSAALENLPICIVPIGEQVSFARQLFPLTNMKKLHDDVRLLCESVLALFNGKIVGKPLLKITTSNNEDEKTVYASTFDFGHYTRLEQLQKRLWYFSYLKYPISSLYHLLTNSLKPVTDSIVYSNPCSGCIRCQPSLLEQYHTSQQQPTTSYFSRVYQSNRSNIKAAVPQVARPVENPDCGVEYSVNTTGKPIELRAKTTNNVARGFQIEISDKFERFNYDKEKHPKQSINVQHIKFNPNIDLISKHMLINHEKLDKDKISFAQCRIELSDKTLKFIEINNDLPSMKNITRNQLDEDALEKTGIFLFPRRHQSIQSP